MSFLASVGVTNVDLMYVGMPRVPQEGEEIFSQDFRVLLGGGVGERKKCYGNGWVFRPVWRPISAAICFPALPARSLSRTAFLRTIWRRRARPVFR